MAVEINIPEDSVLISRTDTKGVITYASPDFLSISGYEDEELLKKPHNIIRHPDMPSQVFKEMWSTIKSGHVWTGIVKNRSKNGDYYWVDATVTPIKESNQITGYVSVRKKPSRRDITRAESLYATIRNSGKKNFFDRLFAKPSFQLSRLSLSLLGVLFISILLNTIGFFLPHLGILIYTITSIGVLISIFAISERFSESHISEITSILGKFSSGEFSLDKYDFNTDKTNVKYNNVVLGLKTLILSLGGILYIVKKMSTNHMIYSDKLQSLSGVYTKLSSDQALTTEIQSNSITEISTSMTEISDTITLQSDNLEVIKNNITEVNHSMTMTAQLLESLSSLNQRTIDKYEVSSEKVTNVLSSIKDMKFISEKIEAIISVIDGIADKTNLLSINASIEAARAGVHGKGFAIVAKEVSNLAEETSVNVKDSTLLIKTFRKTIKDGSTRITEVIDFFNEVKELILELSKTTNEIMETMLSQLEKIMEIQANVEEATKKAESIKDSVVYQKIEISQVSESIQKLVKESKAVSTKSNELLNISSEIHKPAKYLKGLMEHYKF
ncbi:MAG: PAS domain-containing protein [Leptospiraceae bacterium]|nr:PAS domain-containing protein [Leptospiraceae bacterium]